MRVIAFDSCSVARSTPDFKALLGVGVTINNYADFSIKYNQIIDEVFSELAIPRIKEIYKSSELLSLFQGHGVNIVPLIAEKLLPFVEFVDVFYSFFIPKESSHTGVGVYYEEQSEHLPYIKFLDLIQGQFPALCCYSFLKNLTSRVNEKYLLDDCSGLRPSIAINHIIRHPDTQFVFRGDQVNYAIAYADILCKYLKERTQNQGVYFSKHMIGQLNLPVTKFKTTYIGTGWLWDIRPARRQELIVNHKYPHPVIFFFATSGGAFGSDQRMVTEKSPIFRHALRYAAQAHGTVKFFEPKDQDYITDQDILVSHDLASEAKINDLIKLGCLAKKVDITFFKDKS